MASKGYNTKARRLILEFLESKRDTTVSVPDIMDFLKKMGENVNQTTVYRYLNKLDNEKKVLKFSEGEGQKAVYQIVSHDNSCDGHLHVQCTKCGRLLHIDCDFLDTLSGHLKEKHNFSVRYEGSIIYGVCRSCLKN